MGFDADAFLPDGGNVKDNPALAAAFTEAVRQVGERANKVDGFLEMGSLDCPACIDFLRQALGRTPRSGEIWSPKELRALWDAAQWPELEAVSPDLHWAYWSAQKFLEVCVQFRLGVSFD
jgi:hypothetical protein